MRADDALGQALDGEMLEANLAIGLSGGMHDDEIAGMAGLTERVFDAFVEGLGYAHQCETVDGQRRAVGDRRDGGLDGGYSRPPP